MTMEIQVSNELDRHHADADATTIKFKGKRTRRQRPPSPLALTMACSSSSDSEARTVVPHHRLANEDSDPTTTATTTTTFTTSRDSPESAKEEEEDMANCLILLARGQGPIAPKPASDRDGDKVEASCAFSCKTCGRRFPSFQALGGHRASHKKPKLNDDDKNKKPVHMKGNDIGDKQPSAAPCTALSLEITPTATGGAATLSSGNNSGHKIHKCSICGAEFSSGQALGGHMRRHRAVMSGSGANNAESEIKKGRHGQGLQDLDLNLPAPAAEEEPAAAEYAFASKEQVLVFSTSPLALVDCHY